MGASSAMGSMDQSQLPQGQATGQQGQGQEGSASSSGDQNATNPKSIIIPAALILGGPDQPGSPTLPAGSSSFPGNTGTVPSTGAGNTQGTSTVQPSSQVSQSNMGSSGDVLSQNPTIPMPPSSCQRTAQKNRFEQGYRSAWSMILRAWGKFTQECSNYEQFLQMIQRTAQYTAYRGNNACFTTGYRQAITDAITMVTKNCQQECTDIGDTVGATAALLFCDIEEQETKSADLSRCTRISIATCSRAFYNGVNRFCSDKLGSQDYFTELSAACSPSGLGQSTGSGGP
jgi:hypothetical protein